MGAKARRLPTKWQGEIEALVSTLHILDHVVKQKPALNALEESRHRALVAQYVESRTIFAVRRDELIAEVRHGHYHALPGMLRAMDEAASIYELAQSALTSYRATLEAK